MANREMKIKALIECIKQGVVVVIESTDEILCANDLNGAEFDYINMTPKQQAAYNNAINTWQE